MSICEKPFAYGRNSQIDEDCRRAGNQDAWKRWAVCIIADGRQKMHKTVVAQPFYDAEKAALALELNEEDVSMHLFEGTLERQCSSRERSASQVFCCCCRSRRRVCCCVRDADPRATEAELAGDAALPAPQGRDNSTGKYRMGPNFIEHTPQHSPGQRSSAIGAEPPNSAGKACNACAFCCGGSSGATETRPESTYPPLQMIFAVKEENAGKLDSHLWFFDAFSDSLTPQFCFLVDAGTRSGPRSLLKLRDTLKTDPKVAGCCGQMEIDPSQISATNFLHAAQKFEYQLANLMDKSLESAFGFISVLPGAFSAYRYEALRCKDDDGDDVLTTYFSSLNKKLGPKSDPEALGPLKGNMFLAEDRILVFELLSWKGKDWMMRYVSSAPAWTDPVNDLQSLLKQRRRWSNGSFFAMLSTLMSLPRFWRWSAHTPLRKLSITILFLYYIVMQVIQWFTLAIFYLCFKFITKGTVHDAFQYLSPDDGQEGYETFSLLVFQCVDICVVTVIGLQIVAGLGNKPGWNDSDGAHTLAIYVVAAQMLGVITVLMFGSAIFQLVNMWHWQTDDGCTCSATTNLLVCPEGSVDHGDQGCLTAFQKSLAVMTVGGPFVAGLLHKRIFSLLFVFPRYLLCLPIFTVMVPIYAFCNMHDISWGTKGLEKVIPLRERKIEAEIQAKLDKDLRASVGALTAPAAGEPARDDLGRHEMQERRRIKEQGQADKAQLEANRLLTEDEFREFRTWIVSVWVTSNVLLILIMSRECDEEAVFNEDYGIDFKIPGLCAATLARMDTDSSSAYMAQSFTRAILVLAGFINAFRLLGSTYFLLVDKLERWLLRPWDFCSRYLGSRFILKRDPNKKRFVVFGIGLALFLTGTVTILSELLERLKKGDPQADNSTETTSTTWDSLVVIFDPEQDLQEYERLSVSDQRLVLCMIPVATLGALCVLAAMGARPRFLKQRGEVWAQHGTSNFLFPAESARELPDEVRERKIARLRSWKCAQRPSQTPGRHLPGI